MREFSSGKEFGLPPIGTSGINESAPANDSKRSAFPALATKGSVFSWPSSYTTLQVRTSVASGFSEVVNLRNNTATGGSSVDVPTWAAGCLVTVLQNVVTLGVGVSYHRFALIGTTTSGATNYLYYAQGTSSSTSSSLQVLVPFFDEPVFTLTVVNDLGTTVGTVSSQINLLGFVRNV